MKYLIHKLIKKKNLTTRNEYCEICYTQHELISFQKY